jgi:signal transduction histidine kinase
MSVSNRSLFRLTGPLLFIGIAALSVIIAMSIWLNIRAQKYLEAVVEARDTRTAAVELRNAVQTAESSQRGFLYTYNEIYLAPYDIAKTQARRQLEAVGKALADYPDLSLARGRLEIVLSEKIEEMDRTIALKRERREEELRNLVRSNRGKALMDEANVYFAGIIRAADGRLTVAVEEQRSNAEILWWASLLSAGVIVVVAAGVASAVLRYTRDLANARDTLNALNEGLEHRVAERTSEITAINEELQRFAYIVTHDLRAPLVNIMGFTKELEGGIESLQALIDKTAHLHDESDLVVRDARVATQVDLPEAIGFIRSSTRKMDSLITAILKLAREGRRQLNIEPIDLRQAVATSISNVQHQLSDAGGTVTAEIEARAIMADRLSLEQILGNLLDNAIKYRSQKRTLEIGVRAFQIPYQKVQIDVTDNGRGIGRDDLDRVFDLFRRAGIQDQPGEGIGLAHVRTLVRNLGGDVKLASKLNTGTTISVVLPAG